MNILERICETEHHQYDCYDKEDGIHTFGMVDAKFKTDFGPWKQGYVALQLEFVPNESRITEYGDGKLRKKLRECYVTLTPVENSRVPK